MKVAVHDELPTVEVNVKLPPKRSVNIPFVSVPAEGLSPVKYLLTKAYRVCVAKSLPFHQIVIFETLLFARKTIMFPSAKTLELLVMPNGIK